MNESDSNRKPHLKDWVVFLCGLCMGIADLIPGISGGTIAFILGIYQPLLNSLKTLNWTAWQHFINGRWKLLSKHIAWRFLVFLLLGVFCAFMCFAKCIHFLLEHEIYRVYVYGGFFGLILASFVFCLKQIKQWNKQIVLGIFLGILVAYALTGTSFTQVQGNYAIELKVDAVPHQLNNYNSNHSLLTGLTLQSLTSLMQQGFVHNSTPIYNNQHLLIGLAGELITPTPASFFNTWMIFCGAMAVCALLLPGISGSYILTLLGVYPLVLSSLVEFTQGLLKGNLHFESFTILASLGLGILIGVLAFTRTLAWILKMYPDQALAVLSGFMIGAIRSIWPFWTYDYAFIPDKLYKGPQLVFLQPYIPAWHSPLVLYALLCAITGFMSVFLLEYLTKQKLSDCESKSHFS